MSKMHATRVIKRNKSIARFDASKVRRTVTMAFVETRQDGLRSREVADWPVTDVVRRVSEAVAAHDEVTVEQVQDMVVEALRSCGSEDVADSFQRYRDKRSQLRSEVLLPEDGAVADYVHAAKYARQRHDGSLETWEQTVARVENMHADRWPQHADAIRSAFRLVHARRVLPSMRSMQFGGVAALQHNVRMYNCAWTLCDRVRVFQEIFYCLLGGSGMGFSVEHDHVSRLPAVRQIDRTRVRHVVVEDSIEGWADALGELWGAFYLTGEWVEFDYSRIRPEGAPLKTSGGLAPGHVPLRDLLERLRSFLSERPHRRLRPIEVFDCVCWSAEAVLAGGVRRSSLIAIFDKDDTEMLFAKAHGNFVPMGSTHAAPKNTQRQMANISARLIRGQARKSDLARILGISREWGEPGFFWSDSNTVGPNPCGEIGMDATLDREERWHVDTALPAESEIAPGDKPFQVVLPSYDDRRGGHGRFHDRTSQYRPWKGQSIKDWNRRLSSRDARQAQSDARAVETYGHTTGVQFCNLCEVNVALCDTDHDFMEAVQAAAFIGTMQASFDQFPYLGPVTENIVRREALLGIGLTGIMDRPCIGLMPNTLKAGARLAVDTNEMWAPRLGVAPAARVTTVKPSGTASLVLGCVASGIHPHHADRYFRRITAKANEPCFMAMRERNPHMCQQKPDGAWVVTFPVKAPDGAITVKTLPAVDFMEYVFTVYDNWVEPGTVDRSRDGLTHNVSCTVSVGDDEWGAVLDSVWENRNRVAAMSFLPRMGDKLWPFAPREEVVTAADEALWADLVTLYRPVDYSRCAASAATMEPACSGGACNL